VIVFVNEYALIIIANLTTKIRKISKYTVFLFAETFPEFAIIHSCMVGISPEFAIIGSKIHDFIGIFVNC
jgi:hypothetical protein